jgi:hypothetical protein
MPERRLPRPCKAFLGVRDGEVTSIERATWSVGDRDLLSARLFLCLLNFEHDSFETFQAVDLIERCVEPRLRPVDGAAAPPSEKDSKSEGEQPKKPGTVVKVGSLT